MTEVAAVPVPPRLRTASPAVFTMMVCALPACACGSGRPVLSWEELDIEAVAGPTAVASGPVLLAGTDGSLHAVDPVRGDEQWVAALPAPAVASPAAVGPDVWVATSAGVVRIDAASGRNEWTAPVEPPPATGVAVAPGVVVVGTSGGLVALRAEDGVELWRLPTESPVLHTPGTDGTRFIASDRGGWLVCVRAEDGSVLWARDDPAGYLIATPIPAGGRFVLTGYEDTVHAVDAATGRPLWQRYAGNWIVALPILAGESVVFEAATGEVFAVDLQTGEDRWHGSGAPRGSQADLLVADEDVLSVGRDGVMIARSAASGELLGEATLDGRFLGAALSGRDLIVAVASGGVRAYRLPNGGLRSEE